MIWAEGTSGAEFGAGGMEPATTILVLGQLLLDSGSVERLDLKY